jgi:hypothetical protein
MATQNALFPGLESKRQRVVVPEGFRYEEDIIAKTKRPLSRPHSHCLISNHSSFMVISAIDA